MTRFCFFLGVVVIFSACVPNRKYVYVQHNDLNIQVPTDSVVRTYEPEQFEYKIQPNDVLYVRFESLTAEEYDFFRDTQNVGANRNYAVTSELVDPEGRILFPVIGKVRVAGLSIFQVQDSLQATASKYLEDAVVKVRLVNFRFTVLGEVKQEGTINSFNNRTTILEAIGLAGGLAELADRSSVKIIRQKEGFAQVGYVNLLDEDVINSPFYYVHQSDVIVVGALKQRPFRKYAAENFGLLITTASFLLLIINLTK
jgi:polysaccharide biosynthesis/export protein